MSADRFEWSESDVEWGDEGKAPDKVVKVGGTPFEQYLTALPGRFGPATGPEEAE